MKKGYLKKGDSITKGDSIQNDIGATLILQNDGNLVLYNDENERDLDNVIWSTDTSGYHGGKWLTFENDGNVVLYDYEGHICWQTDTQGTDANILILNGYSLELFHIPNGRILEEVDFRSLHSLYSTSTDIQFTKPLKLGVVVIGSLFWQNDGGTIDKPILNERKNWRESNFLSESGKVSSVPIEFPIRYGRMSSGDVYTMVVSETCYPLDKLGTAQLLISKNQFYKFSEVKAFAEKLAKAEGMAHLSAKWGALISFAFNSNKSVLDAKAINQFRKNWKHESKASMYFENFKMKTEKKSPFDQYGELNYLKNQWIKSTNSNLQATIDGLDLVLTTITKPRLSVNPDSSQDYPDISNVTYNVFKDKVRYYFYNNVIHGIKTHQDKEVIEPSIHVYSPSIYEPFILQKFQCVRLDDNLLYFSERGQILLYNLKDMRIYWSSPENQLGHYLNYQEDGNLVIYNSINNPVWSTETYLYKGISKESLKSYKCFKVLKVSDNRLFVESSRTSLKDGGETKFSWSTPYFFSNPHTKSFKLNKGECIIMGDYKIVFSESGQILLEGNNGIELWQSPNNQKGNYLSYQDDGNLVIYENEKISKWSAGIYLEKNIDKNKKDVEMLSKSISVSNNRIKLNFVRAIKEKNSSIVPFVESFSWSSAE